MAALLGWMAKLTGTLRESPTTLPALGAVALFVAWAANQAGYPLTHWAPGALIVLALLAIALFSVPVRLAELPMVLRIALGCLALYTALSYLSILWAGVPADAWEGANRTLLYLLVFALFSLWPRRGASAVLLIGAWTIAMIALAVFVMLHVDASTHPAQLFSEGRLKYPAGYENASAAMWAMVVWPALLLAASARIPWAVRGLLAGGAVLLADLALLSLSRGSLFAMVAMLILVFALLPGRLRAFAVLVPSAIGVGVTTALVLRVGDRLSHGGDVKAALHGATTAVFVAAALVGLVVAAGAALESRGAFSQSTIARIRTAWAAIAIATVVAALAGGLAVAGDPIARVEHGWHTFKGGYAADRSGGSRLTSGLGSNRYDFYRVAIDEFAAHPLGGIGVDNFQQQYLLHGRSGETPHYPHSVELRTLTETGLLGALLAIVGLAAALWASSRAWLTAAARRADPLGASVALAALAGFVYWLVHGSVDWFWEFAGLGAPAFALLGLACALAPAQRSPGTARDPVVTQPASARPRERRRRVPVAATIAATTLAALAASVSLAAPWLSQTQVHGAARIWRTAPRKAYADLQDAARLNPLSDEPFLVAGTIALRFGDVARADREFSRALARTPGDAYATLERGAIASTRGERTQALKLLDRAVRLNPRDELTRQALALALQGRRVDIDELNRSILLMAGKFA
ncbi:MAG TPA: O-antigen ligase family protein [Solirubrobacteraceae bacterium]|jgi:tetratricopeptide (TPR) repeat protein|nr:O-antigen ligase family protein [Solirubrobacteraceae bacterium]